MAVQALPAAPRHGLLRAWLGIVLLLAGSFAGGCGEDRSEADVILETQFGEIGLRLYKDTPQHRANFLRQIRAGTYDSAAFQRIIPDFMIQGGTPVERVDGRLRYRPRGDSEKTLPPEFSSRHLHVRGALGAARWGDERNPNHRSSATQFYLVTGSPVDSTQLDSLQAAIRLDQLADFRQRYIQRPAAKAFRETDMERLMQTAPDSARQLAESFQSGLRAAFRREGDPFTYGPEQRRRYAQQGGAPHLDMKHTVFGEVVFGMDVVDEIANQTTNEANRPEEVIWLKARVAAADSAS